MAKAKSTDKTPAPVELDNESDDMQASELEDMFADAQDTRASRELEMRDKTARKTAWKDPELLPKPNDKPGITFRYVRISTLGNLDATNVSAKIREGWTPVLAKDHPEITMVTIENDRFRENIVIGGLLLCSAPTELIEERNAHFKNLTKNQMHSVDNNLMRESDPRMPVFNERRSVVKNFGSG